MTDLIIPNIDKKLESMKKELEKWIKIKAQAEQSIIVISGVLQTLNKFLENQINKKDGDVVGKDDKR